MAAQKSSEFLYDKDLEWKEVAPGLWRQVAGFDGTMLMAKVRFEKGAVGALHQHVHTQVSYVARGRFEATVGGRTSVLGEGDSFFVPSNVVHGCVCLEEGMLIDVFTPVREDFLEG